MPGGAPGLQNQRGVRKGSRWVRFPFTSAILFLAGVGCVVFGVGFHRVAVLEEAEEEIEIEVPAPFGPLAPGEAPEGEQAPFLSQGQPSAGPVLPSELPGAMLPAGMGEALPGGMVPGAGLPLAPPAFFPPQKQKVVRVVQKPSEPLEPVVIYAATVGAVSRLETGELRLVAGALEGPALCPT